MLLRIERASKERQPTLLRLAAAKLVLCIPVEKIELVVDAIGSAVATHSVDVIRRIVGFVGFSDWLLMVVGSDSKAILHPTFQDGAFDQVGIDPPTAQESHIAVLNGPPSALRFIGPLVQVELDGHVVVEELRTLALVGDLVEVFEKEPVCMLRALYDERLRIIVEIA